MMEATSLSEQSLIEKLDNLPEHTTRDFELKLTKIAETLEETEYSQLLLYLENRIASQTANQILFASFVILTIYARRMKNISQFREIVERFGEKFIDFPLYPHILSLLYKEIGTNDAIEQAVAFAREATQNLPNQVGVLHNYAEAVVHIKEHGFMVSQEELQEAYTYINRVVHLSPRYAKFHCTRGRILAALGKFNEAKEAIRKAIDMEESSKKDYAIRINDYLYHLSRVQTNEFSQVFSDKIALTEKSFDEAKDEIDQSISKLKSENLQMLGFFTAIISFTIGSFNILGDKNFLESALLILILSGALVLAFVGFGLLFQTKNQHPWRTVIISLLSLGVIVGSMAAYYFIN
ncbi:hypothetical protein ACFRCQ_27195 [Cytobacillus firmus]|uniref:hypothetical protein n=1 Tax=Cytobacillus firmus TaxID=1399 RepID=UPI0036B474E2